MGGLFRENPIPCCVNIVSVLSFSIFTFKIDIITIFCNRLYFFVKKLFKLFDFSEKLYIILIIQPVVKML